MNVNLKDYEEELHDIIGEKKMTGICRSIRSGDGDMMSFYEVALRNDLGQDKTLSLPNGSLTIYWISTVK